MAYYSTYVRGKIPTFPLHIPVHQSAYDLSRSVIKSPDLKESSLSSAASKSNTAFTFMRTKQNSMYKCEISHGMKVFLALTCSGRRRKMSSLRDTDAVWWYITRELMELNFTSQRKYFPAPSRNTLKCWTPLLVLRWTKMTEMSDLWNKPALKMKETEERQQKPQLIVHVRKVSVNLLYEKQKRALKFDAFI